MEQSSTIDGCTLVQSMMKVLLPVAAPGIVTTLIFIFINAWNEYTVALCLISTDTYKPLTVGINTFNGYNMIEWQYLFAASIRHHSRGYPVYVHREESGQRPRLRRRKRLILFLERKSIQKELSLALIVWQSTWPKRRQRRTALLKSFVPMLEIRKEKCYYENLH